MNDASTKEFSDLLAAREADLQDSLRGLRDELAAPDAGTGAVRDSVEDGDARMMASIDLAHVHRLEDELREVRQARGRLLQGDYGRCETCDEDIPIERLRARPEARFCLRHEEEWEKAHPAGAPMQA
ncbi:TraR/DksA family transcriptional regulator [Ramlibacter algicola]|uniref:TraR/DksA C4-type zinc finger protein n=1 Tax=Ramlibacter algicola TaxID=2795217 RepID=A0A934PZV5_9BURK|nr:TraR/DksA C4-type zinc finger protein [Ramlibacter algicola]MBK0392148.1 TraR/DksA C4-type zinc finger protein [Ramlibacter algicola]